MISVKTLKPFMKKEIFRFGDWYSNGYIAIHVDELDCGHITPEIASAIFGRSVTLIARDNIDAIVVTYDKRDSLPVWKATNWVLADGVKKKRGDITSVRLYIQDGKQPDGLFLDNDVAQAFGIEMVCAETSTSPAVVDGKKMLVMPTVGLVDTSAPSWRALLEFLVS